MPMKDFKINQNNLVVEHIRVTDLPFFFNLPYLFKCYNDLICKKHLSSVLYFVLNHPIALSPPIVSKDSDGHFSLLRPNKDLIHIIALYFPLITNTDLSSTLIHPVKLKEQISIPVCSTISNNPCDVNLFDILTTTTLSNRELSEFEQCIKKVSELTIPVVVFDKNVRVPKGYCPDISNY